jgi:proteasome lid subunit RPN8/RPN11
MNSWALRSRYGPNGEVVRFHERPKIGCPGVVERRYQSPPERTYYAPPASIQLIEPGRRMSARTMLAPPRFRQSSSGSNTLQPTIQMRRKCFRLLDEGIRRSGSGVETAGALFGCINDSTVTIHEAVVAVRDQQAKSCRLDMEKVDGLIREHRQAEGLVLVGTWHSEPSHGAGEPSPADLAHWTSFARASELPWFVGLTLRKRDHYYLGWRRAIACAHVFARTAAGVDRLADVDLQLNSWTL